MEAVLLLLTTSTLTLGWITLKLNKEVVILKKYSNALCKEAEDLTKVIKSKNKDLDNLRKTNTLLKAKIDNQEQKIKKISQFFGK